MKQREKHGPGRGRWRMTLFYIGIGASGQIPVPSYGGALGVVLLPDALHITAEHTVKICSQTAVYPLETGISTRIMALGTAPYYPQNKETK